MVEMYLLLILGLIFVIFNKSFASGCRWFQEEIMKLERYSLWGYRIPVIGVGFFFISVAIVKLSN